MSFLETPRFPEDISYGSSGGPMFKNTIVITHSGHETRNRDWVYPLHKYNVGYGIRDEEDILEEILEFFWSVGGNLHGFRYKDWADYSTGGPGGGMTSGPTITDQDQFIGTGVSGQTEVQLIKTYTKGALDFERKILKPVAGTVVGALDGTPLGPGDATVDSTTGIITFTTPLSGGEQITAGFEFDVPVRFDVDATTINLDDYSAMSTNFTMRELRSP